MVDQDVQGYVTELLGGEDDFLRRIRLEAESKGLPIIQVPLELGRLLAVLVAASSARQVLEIGTLFGYSGILLARALPADGRLVTLEVNPIHARLARDNFAAAGVADRVTLIDGNALESLAGLAGQEFDLVFIDADKQTYPEYLERALALTHPGSVIVADNVWRGGGVLDPGDDEGNRALGHFNQLLARTPQLRTTFVPTRGGQDAASVSVVLA